MSDADALSRSSKAPLADRWRASPWWVRVIALLFAVGVLYQFVGSTVSGITGSSNQVSGSSSTLDDGATGTAALADLLSQSGVRVATLTTALPAPGSHHGVLFVLDPTQWTTGQATSLAALVRGGATVVVSGDTATTTSLRALGTTGVTWVGSAVGRTPVPRSPLWDESPGVVDSPSAGLFALAPRATPTVLAGGRTDALAVGVHDGGWLIALASASALDNANLATADNAAFGLALGSAATGPATFDEYVHGIGRGGSGLAGLPAPWRYGLGLALVGLLIGIVASARRFGPVQRAQRALIPPRVRYVDAVATHLATLATPEVVVASEPVARALRRTLTSRLSLADDATDVELQAAATRAPRHGRTLSAAAARLATPARTEADVVEMGHAFASVIHSTVDGVGDDD